MPMYEFECVACGPFELRRSIGAWENVACARCGVHARRIFTVPLLDRVAAPLRGALAREERSAHHPEVIRRPVR